MCTVQLQRHSVSTPDRVRVVQDITGGGFGGKEAYPSILACEVAVAAYHAGGKPVRVIFDRREDMEFTSKRHPSLSTYRVAVKDRRVTAMDIDVIFNAGGYTNALRRCAPTRSHRRARRLQRGKPARAR
jgi:xanthine dehydrogenase molybdopterin-binding subunit B